MFSFEVITVVVVVIIFVLFGIGAYKAEKVIAAKRKELQESKTRTRKDIKK